MPTSRYLFAGLIEGTDKAGIWVVSCSMKRVEYEMDIPEWVADFSVVSGHHDCTATRFPTTNGP